MFDGLVYVIFGIITLIAFLRGFIKELLSIVGQVVAIYLTYYFNDYFTTILNHGVLKSGTMASIIAYVAVYLVCIIAFWVINTMISLALRPIRLGFLDRFFGIVLGATKSYILCFAIYIAIIIVYPMLEGLEDNTGQPTAELEEKQASVPKWLQNAKTYTAFKFTQDLLDHTLSDVWVDGFVESIQKKIETKSITKNNFKNESENKTPGEKDVKQPEATEKKIIVDDVLKKLNDINIKMPNLDTITPTPSDKPTTTPETKPNTANPLPNNNIHTKNTKSNNVMQS